MLVASMKFEEGEESSMTHRLWVTGYKSYKYLNNSNESETNKDWNDVFSRFINFHIFRNHFQENNKYKCTTGNTIQRTFNKFPLFQPVGCSIKSKQVPRIISVRLFFSVSFKMAPNNAPIGLDIVNINMTYTQFLK